LSQIRFLFSTNPPIDKFLLHLYFINNLKTEDMSKRRICEVTQLTSKTTSVGTQRHYQGIITTVALTDSADASFVFTVNNSVVQNTTQINLTTEYPSLTGTSEREVTLTGTSGTANVVVGGVNYLATFTTNLTTSANNFVTSHGATLLALGITVTASSGVLTFVALTASFPTISVANVSGDLAGTLASVSAIETTGLPIATIESYTRGSFVVRVTNVGTSALNKFAKIHYSIVHN